MYEEQHNSQIEKIENMMVEDNISIDEQDQDKLEKYKDQTISDSNQSGTAIKLVMMLYLKLKNSKGENHFKKVTSSKLALVESIQME